MIKTSKNITIRKIEKDEELQSCVHVLRTGFQTVAQDFGLTEKNCPTNAAFMTIQRLEALREKGIEIFGLFKAEEQIGIICIEKNNPDVYYIEKLTVLPEYRHRGYGKRMMDFAMNYIFNQGGEKVSIGIIDKNEILKKWYLQYGFSIVSTKKFKHLPFTVCFLEFKRE